MLSWQSLVDDKNRLRYFKRDQCCEFCLQEQYKFVYDTLEEFVVCGASHFLVQQLSDMLKQKSVKDKTTKKKLNEYEKEYAVSLLLMLLLMLLLL